MMIDLRSDTVTLPTPAMREAMANAHVGDDVYGEDPTINRLEEMAAERMGKQAALFVPSGTMGNLAAILAHCGRGDEVILGDKSHTFLYEAGGISALGGVHSCQIPNQADGTLLLEDIRSAVRGENIHFPKTRLICLENTQNRCGGTALPLEYHRAVYALAREHGISLHIDGARIFNAAAALGVNVNDISAYSDSVTFCLSKGLSAPVGSLLCGGVEFIASARRVRKQLGGGMRQAGVLAAAGIVALETMTERLVDDHHRAKRLAEELGKIPALRLEGEPQTNMVFLYLHEECPLSPAQVSEKLREHNVLAGAGALGARRFRLVTHSWIDDAALEQAIAAFHQVLG